MSPNQFEFTLTGADMVEAFGRASRRARRKLLHWKVVLIYLVVIALLVTAGIVSAWLSSTPPAPTTAPVANEPESNFWLLIAPWAIAFVIVWCLLFWIRRAGSKKHRFVGRPFVLIVEDDKLTWVEPFSRVEYQWPGLFDYDESKNMFLLYVSDPKGVGMLMFHMVPKRAFASELLLNEFRNLLDIKVRRPSAFPVLPPKLPGA